MKLRHLEIELEKLSGFTDPNPQLEQYMTPAFLAARLLFTAYQQGDIRDKVVCDLGCGTGILAL